METINVVVYMTLFLVVLAVSMALMPGLLAPRQVNAASTTQIEKRATGSLSVIGDPELTVRAKEGAKTEYDIDARVTLSFKGEAANQITVFPVLSYKGERERAVEPVDMTIRKGETAQRMLKFRVVSSEKPMIIRKDDAQFSCPPDDLQGCYVREGQKLLLKDFFFSFSTFQLDTAVLPYVPAGFPKIGSCFLNAMMHCPLENKVASLKLADEKKSCSDQKGGDKAACSRTEKMCGTLVDITLIKIETAEGFLERLMPGSPSCEDKKFAVDIKVGKVDTEVFAGKFSWKVGEDATISFWEKPEKKELENCWHDSGEGCADLYAGSVSAAMPPERYSVVS